MSSLSDILAKKDPNIGKVGFQDFLDVVCQVIAADIAENDPSRSSAGSNESSCEVRIATELIGDFSCANLIYSVI